VGIVENAALLGQHVLEVAAAGQDLVESPTNPLRPSIRWLSTLRNVTNCAPSTLLFLVRLLIIATPESEDSQAPDRAFTEISSLTEPEFHCPMA